MTTFQMLAAVSDALSGLGFDIAKAESGSGLIDRLAIDGPFDLIVTDVSMPWMDGVRALRSIRSAGVTTPVVVMTALKDSAISTHVRALGANSVLLRKPFDFGELAEAVMELVPSARSGRKRGHE